MSRLSTFLFLPKMIKYLLPINITSFIISLLRHSYVRAHTPLHPFWYIIVSVAKDDRSKNYYGSHNADQYRQSSTTDQNALTKNAAMSIINYEESIGEKLVVRYATVVVKA